MISEDSSLAFYFGQLTRLFIVRRAIEGVAAVGLAWSFGNDYQPWQDDVWAIWGILFVGGMIFAIREWLVTFVYGLFWERSVALPLVREMLRRSRIEPWMINPPRLEGLLLLADDDTYPVEARVDASAVAASLGASRSRVPAWVRFRMSAAIDDEIWRFARQ